MQEITKLVITRQQLAEKHFYYNGCESIDVNSEEATAAENEILNLAADVLINILTMEYEEKK